MVHGIPLKQALLEFHSWLTSKGVMGSDKRYAYAVDGQSDIGHFLQTSLKLNGLPFLHDFRRYIDVKHVFQSLGYSTKTVKLKRMLKTMGMQFKGNLHFGLDDTQNVAKIVLRLIEDGHILDYTHKLVPRELLYRVSYLQMHIVGYYCLYRTPTWSTLTWTKCSIIGG